MDTEKEYDTINPYDRLRGAMHDKGALWTKPSTLQHVDKITGRAETFVIVTARAEEGDYVFVELVDTKNTVTRLALPPRAANAIASQRDALTSRRRSIAAKAIAKARKDRGELPGFMRKKHA